MCKVHRRRNSSQSWTHPIFCNLFMFTFLFRLFKMALDRQTLTYQIKTSVLFNLTLQLNLDIEKIDCAEAAKRKGKLTSEKTCMLPVRPAIYALDPASIGRRRSVDWIVLFANAFDLNSPGATCVCYLPLETRNQVTLHHMNGLTD